MMSDMNYLELIAVAALCATLVVALGLHFVKRKFFR